MKNYADKHRRPSEIRIGDYAWLSTAHLRLHPEASRKLAPRWTGPFPVIQAVGPVAFRLDLPQRLRNIHDVFHVS